MPLFEHTFGVWVGHPDETLPWLGTQLHVVHLLDLCGYSMNLHGQCNSGQLKQRTQLTEQLNHTEPTHFPRRPW